jgi:hypothetical protein
MRKQRLTSRTLLRARLTTADREQTDVTQRFRRVAWNRDFAPSFRSDGALTVAARVGGRSSICFLSYFQRPESFTVLANPIHRTGRCRTGHRTTLIGPGPLLCWLLHQLVFLFLFGFLPGFRFLTRFSSFILLRIFIFRKIFKLRKLFKFKKK